MKIDLYQVDAFASALFEGNPAAVCPLPEWLPDEKLQAIAMENNLSETAYFVQAGERYRLRWFTPATEVDLCGHATLASAHVLFSHLGYNKAEIIFVSNSGLLKVCREHAMLRMDFPASAGEKVDPPEKALQALGIEPVEAYKAADLMLVAGHRSQVEAIRPDWSLLGEVDARGIIVTAQDEEYDFVSRFFAPAVGVNEDPVTGSSHTMLAPYWAKRLNKSTLSARQLSRRGGNIQCVMNGNRVELGGEARTFMTGTIEI